MAAETNIEKNLFLNVVLRHVRFILYLSFDVSFLS